MLYIIYIVGVGMVRDEFLDAGLHIAPLVGDNLAGNPRFRDGFLQLLVDDLAVGLANRNQCDRLDVGMAEDFVFPFRLQPRQPQTDHGQAFHTARLDGKVHNPHPIVGDFLTAGEFVIPQTQQPKTRAAPGRDRRRQREELGQDMQDFLYTAESHARRELKQKGQRNQTQAVGGVPGSYRQTGG